MLWQDLVIMIIVIVFTISLIPQVYHGYNKKKGLITLATSIPTCAGLFVLSYVYSTLDLYLSAIISFFTAVIWLVMVLQRLKYGKA
ncbi:MAG: hypothetical protein ABIG89_03315 [Candidatus Woesearchaeota archaeon]